jgi:hypothetical protein
MTLTRGIKKESFYLQVDTMRRLLYVEDEEEEYEGKKWRRGRREEGGGRREEGGGRREEGGRRKEGGEEGEKTTFDNFRTVL